MNKSDFRSAYIPPRRPVSKLNNVNMKRSAKAPILVYIKQSKEGVVAKKRHKDQRNLTTSALVVWTMNNTAYQHRLSRSICINWLSSTPPIHIIILTILTIYYTSQLFLSPTRRLQIPNPSFPLLDQTLSPWALLYQYIPYGSVRLLDHHFDPLRYYTDTERIDWEINRKVGPFWVLRWYIAHD
jgi:hypothetical protein